MAPFIEELWNSIFTPGPTPTLLVATNASFAALQLLLLILLVATYSIHFVILSALSGALWYSINWFARELQAERAKEQSLQKPASKRDKSAEAESDTETEAPPPARKPVPNPALDSSSLLRPSKPDVSASEALRKRRSLGDSSGYVSTDSEWEKVSEGEEKGS